MVAKFTFRDLHEGLLFGAVMRSLLGHCTHASEPCERGRRPKQAAQHPPESPC